MKDTRGVDGTVTARYSGVTGEYVSDTGVSTIKWSNAIAIKQQRLVSFEYL